MVLSFSFVALFSQNRQNTKDYYCHEKFDKKCCFTAETVTHHDKRCSWSFSIIFRKSVQQAPENVVCFFFFWLFCREKLTYQIILVA